MTNIDYSNPQKALQILNELENSITNTFYELIFMDRVVSYSKAVAALSPYTPFKGEMNKFQTTILNIKYKIDLIRLSWQNHALKKIKDLKTIAEDIVKFVEKNEAAMINAKATALENALSVARSLRGHLSKCYARIEEKIMPAESVEVISLLDVGTSCLAKDDQGRPRHNRTHLFGTILTQISVELGSVVANIDKKVSKDNLSHYVLLCIDLQTAVAQHELREARSEIKTGVALAASIKPDLYVRGINDLGYGAVVNTPIK